MQEGPAPTPVPTPAPTPAPILAKGRFVARPAAGGADMAAVLALRGLCFRGDPARDDRDRFDDVCDHVLIVAAATGAPVGCFRLLALNGQSIARSYAAQHYDLAALARFPGPMLELGRFCVHPDWPDPDILRLAWGALTRRVDADGVALLFGCSSFRGTDAAAHRDALGILHRRHRAPDSWAPGRRADEVVRLTDLPGEPDAAMAARRMPPLLRTYLAMGGWVSDHAVVDRELDTLHVFTGLEIARVPPARARLLRAVAG